MARNRKRSGLLHVQSCRLVPTSALLAGAYLIILILFEKKLSVFIVEKDEARYTLLPYIDHKDRRQLLGKNGFLDLALPKPTPLAYFEWDGANRDWIDLPEKVRNAAGLLGFDEKKWDEEGEIPLYNKTLHDLTEEERRAAISLGLEDVFAGGPTVSHEDPVFADIRLSTRTYQQFCFASSAAACKTWRPMALIRLPGDFQGKYHPRNLEEFRSLAHMVSNNVVVAPPFRSSRYAVVTVCINMDVCNLSIPNQKAYASRHGYEFILLSQPVPGIPFKMMKYLALTWAMDQGYNWLLMLDADAIITNHNVTLQSLIPADSSAPDGISLILTRGGNWRNVHGINNGVFLLRNTQWSRRHCFHIFTARYSYTIFLGKGTLIDQPIQMSLLVAQNELQWPPKTELEAGRHVMIIPKRQLNSFKRDGSAVSERDRNEDGQWEKGDFIAHFATPNKYPLMLDFLEQENLPGLMNSFAKR